MKKPNSPTLLQQLLEGKEILTKRPAEMSYEEYKVLRVIQNKIIKKGLK